MNNQRIVVSLNLKRTIKIMKLTVLMLTVCLSQMVAATYAQTTKLNVSAKEETLENGDTRTVMKLHPAIAPYKVAVLPLTKKQSDKAEEVYATLAKHFSVEFDVAGQIGKRYRRQDAIGTPYCVTVDFDTMEDNAVTVRDRDTMEQVRLPIDQLVGYIQDKITF